MIDGDAFDPERRGPELRIPFDGLPPNGMVRVANPYVLSAPRQTVLAVTGPAIGG